MLPTDTSLIATYEEFNEQREKYVSADDIVIYDDYREEYLSLLQKNVGVAILREDRGKVFKRLIRIRKRGDLPTKCLVMG